MLEGLNHPLLENDDVWSVYGFSYANYLSELGPDHQQEILKRSSLDLAMRDAFRKLRRFLMTAHNLSEDEAISLMSVAADFSVTQVVDANWGSPVRSGNACSPANDEQAGILFFACAIWIRRDPGGGCCRPCRHCRSRDDH